MNESMSGGNARMRFEHDGQLARITLAAPKANVLDRSMMSSLAEFFDDLRTALSTPDFRASDLVTILKYQRVGKSRIRADFGLIEIGCSR